MFLSKIFTRRTDLFLKQKVNFFALTKGGPIILPPLVVMMYDYQKLLAKHLHRFQHLLREKMRMMEPCLTN